MKFDRCLESVDGMSDDEAAIKCFLEIKIRLKAISKAIDAIEKMEENIIDVKFRRCSHFLDLIGEAGVYSYEMIDFMELMTVKLVCEGMFL